jgi:hypothetical protein
MVAINFGYTKTIAKTKAQGKRGEKKIKSFGGNTGFAIF